MTQPMQEFVQLITQEQICVPVWEFLILVTIVTLALILRGSKLNLLLITYVFALHMTWNFMKLHFGPIPLIVFAVLGIFVLLMGFFSVLTERN